MFQTLRLKLTLQFVFLSSLVYTLITAAAVFVFQKGLTEAVDEQLDALTVAAATIAAYDDGKLKFKRRHADLRVETYKVMPTVQLWDKEKKLVESFGPPGVETFFFEVCEHPLHDSNVRAMSHPITIDKSVVGYVQVQLSTGYRDRAISEFVEAALLMAPVVIFGLASCGYYFSGKAIKPIEETLSLQKQFLADAGHELKTPVAIIQAACDNLSEDLQSDPQVVERLSVVMRSTERMQKLISDLLLLTRTEQSQSSFEVGRIDLEMLLREVIGEFSDLADDKEIKLTADELHPAMVSGDREALHKVLTNLVKNALRYTNTGGEVTITLTTSSSCATVKVQDSGIGIPKDALDKIFDRFYRVDQSRARTQGGSGLGLAIVKALVEKHNGTISVSSEPGHGSTFTVTLPLAVV